MLSPSVFSNFYLVIQECAWLAAAGMHLLPLKKHPVAKWGPQNDEATQLHATIAAAEVAAWRRQVATLTAA